MERCAVFAPVSQPWRTTRRLGPRNQIDLGVLPSARVLDQLDAEDVQVEQAAEGERGQLLAHGGDVGHALGAEQKLGLQAPVVVALQERRSAFGAASARRRRMP